MILHTLVWESRTTPRFIWKASASAEAFSFYAPVPCPLWEQRPPLYPLPSMPFPLCPPGGGKGLLWGRCPPSRPLSKPPNHPPYLALRLCVHCPPVPTKASLSEQAGAYIHPRMGGGMKSGQGCYPSCVPRPAVGGIAGVRARPETPQTLGRVVRREGCRHDVGLGRAPPGRPRRFFFSSPPGGRRG